MWNYDPLQAPPGFDIVIRIFFYLFRWNRSFEAFYAPSWIFHSPNGIRKQKLITAQITENAFCARFKYWLWCFGFDRHPARALDGFMDGAYFTFNRLTWIGKSLSLYARTRELFFCGKSSGWISVHHIRSSAVSIEPRLRSTGISETIHSLTNHRGDHIGRKSHSQCLCEAPERGWNGKL